MQTVEYKTTDGFKYQVLLPDGESLKNAKLGIRVGPPDLTSLGLPKEVEKRLNNALYDRGLLTRADARRRTAEITAAWQSALRVDVTRVLDVYRGES